MTTEEEQNIDDLIDYKDFESDLQSINEEDSFNDDIIKIYEDHRKNFASNATEIQNSQRPMSKYQRNALSENLSSEDENDLEENELENIVTKNLSNEEIEKVFLRFNKFIEKNKIAKKDFMENPKLFLKLDELKDLFRKIHFEISRAELYHFFNCNNNTAKEGYILGKQFLINFRNEILWNEQQLTEKNSTPKESRENEPYTNKNSEQSHIKKININTPPKENEIKKESLVKNNSELNKEFRLLKEEIFQIVKENNFSGKIFLNYFKNLAKNRSSSKINPSNELRQLNNRIRSSIPPLNRKKENSNVILVIPPSAKALRPLTTKSKPRSSIKEILEEKTRKRKAEEEMIKLALERGKKETERDIIKKMTEANHIAEELGVMKSFSAYLDENEGLVCKVFDKITKSVFDLNLKKFLFDYKKLKKMLKHHEESKNLRQNLNSAYGSGNLGENLNNNDDNLNELNRDDRQKIVKDILLNSLELKIQLKTQLRILRNKKLIEPSLVMSTLKLNNLDDDNISLNLQNIDFSYTFNGDNANKK